MRILWDECVPFPLIRLLPEHACSTAQQMGWDGASNGVLLDMAEASFDLFLTADQNLRYEQNLGGRNIRVLEVNTNDLRRLKAAIELLRQTLIELDPGELRRLEIP